MCLWIREETFLKHDISLIETIIISQDLSIHIKCPQLLTQQAADHHPEPPAEVGADPGAWHLKLLRCEVRRVSSCTILQMSITMLHSRGISYHYNRSAHFIVVWRIVYHPSNDRSVLKILFCDWSKQREKCKSVREINLDLWHLT